MERVRKDPTLSSGSSEQVRVTGSGIKATGVLTHRQLLFSRLAQAYLQRGGMPDSRVNWDQREFCKGSSAEDPSRTDYLHSDLKTNTTHPGLPLQLDCDLLKHTVLAGGARGERIGIEVSREA